jgi:FkbM family methyltransferase
MVVCQGGLTFQGALEGFEEREGGPGALVRPYYDLRLLVWCPVDYVRPYKPAPATIPVTTQERRLQMMRHAEVDLVIDAGANTGQYSSSLREAGYSGRILSFEPGAEAFAALQRTAGADGQWIAIRAALGSEQSETRIHISRNSKSSSLLPMLDRHLRNAPESAYISEEVVPQLRLDGLAEDLLGGCRRIILKIDTQGFEEQVLRGAVGLLDRVVLIECELSLTPLYEGQALFLDVVQLLHSYGFRPVDFNRGFTERTSGCCLQVDGIFARAAVE